MWDGHGMMLLGAMGEGGALCVCQSVRQSAGLLTLHTLD